MDMSEQTLQLAVGALFGELYAILAHDNAEPAVFRSIHAVENDLNDIMIGALRLPGDKPFMERLASTICLEELAHA